MSDFGSWIINMGSTGCVLLVIRAALPGMHSILTLPSVIQVWFHIQGEGHSQDVVLTCSLLKRWFNFQLMLKDLNGVQGHMVHYVQISEYSEENFMQKWKFCHHSKSMKIQPLYCICHSTSISLYFFSILFNIIVKWMGIGNVRPHIQNHVIYWITLSFTEKIPTSFALLHKLDAMRTLTRHMVWNVQPDLTENVTILQGGDLVWIRMMWIVWQRTFFTIKVMKIHS